MPELKILPALVKRPDEAAIVGAHTFHILMPPSEYEMAHMYRLRSIVCMKLDGQFHFPLTYDSALSESSALALLEGKPLLHDEMRIRHVETDLDLHVAKLVKEMTLRSDDGEYVRVFDKLHAFVIEEAFDHLEQKMGVRCR